MKTGISVATDYTPSTACFGTTLPAYVLSYVPLTDLLNYYEVEQKHALIS